MRLPFAKTSSGLVLRDLDSINWAQLQHAYGSAVDVPRLLRDLASRHHKKGLQALNTFYGNIWHQGTIYQATSYAVPFLRQILADPLSPHHAGILELLAHLAFGSSYHVVHQSLIFLEERDKPEFRAKIDDELAHVKRAHAAVREGVTQYLELWGAPSPEVQTRAIYLGDVPEVAPALWQRLKTESNPMVRASLWMGFAFCELSAAEIERIENAFAVVPNQSDKEQSKEEPSGQHLERWALATAILRVGSEYARRNAAQVMIESLDAPDSLLRAYTELPFCREGLAADSMEQLLGLGLTARQFHAPLVAKLRQTPNEFAALNLLSSICPLFFGHYSEQNPVRWENLDEGQREVMRAIAQTDGVWGDGKVTFVNRTDLLRYFGLPDQRSAFQSLMEGTS